MSSTPLLTLPEVFASSPQWDQAVNDGMSGIECATNEVSFLDMSTGDKLLADVEQQRSFFWLCQNTTIGRVLTLSHKVNLFAEARRFLCVKNEGPSDLTVKVSTNGVWQDILPMGSARLYYIKGNEVHIIGSFGLASAAPSLSYDVSVFVSGQPPVIDEIYRLAFTRDVRFEGNFLGSRASARLLPSNPSIFDVKKNGVTGGTITLTPGGAHTFTTTSGSPFLFAPGSVMTIVPPNPQDASLADVGFTLAGTKL